ncbi:hypothetical protein TrLO_g372 [Triparma laevis f. longispina]|uniref:Uncharacterized protein n=1 Tax=Triparma laevis f. longispina TaxID=1714387 RepID=A0A9W7CH87_9STRA|nr:hypothetical protein TrLO_g372 [Triparma laevis f. longispina]
MFTQFDLDIHLSDRSRPPPPPRSSSSSFNDENPKETQNTDPQTFPYLTFDITTTTQGSYDFTEKCRFLFCSCGWRFHPFSSTETSTQNYTYALNGNLNGHYKEGPSPHNDHAYAIDCEYKVIKCPKEGTYDFVTSSGTTTATITIEDGLYDQMKISFHSGRVNPEFYYKRVQTRNTIRYPEIEDQEEIVVDIPRDGRKGEVFKNLHIN